MVDLPVIGSNQYIRVFGKMALCSENCVMNHHIFFLYVTCHHHTFTPHSQWVGPFLPSERPQIFVEWIQKIAGNIPQILVAAISHHTVAESLHHILEVHGANPYVTTDTR